VNLYSKTDSSVNSRLDVLMDLERVRDPRVVPFLLQVLVDPGESGDVRIHVVKLLRSGTGIVAPFDRPAVARALGELLVDRSHEELQLQAALVLGEFTQVDDVLANLTAVSLARDESIDIRYAAFTSIERAGATAQAIAALREIERDETLGGAARSL